MLHPPFENSTSNVILFRICFAAFCLSVFYSMRQKSPTFYYDFLCCFCPEKWSKEIIIYNVYIFCRRRLHNSLRFFSFTANVSKYMRGNQMYSRRVGWEKGKRQRESELKPTQRTMKDDITHTHTARARERRDKNESGMHIYDKQTKNPSKITPIATVLFYWI